MTSGSHDGASKLSATSSSSASSSPCRFSKRFGRFTVLPTEMAREIMKRIWPVSQLVLFSRTSVGRVRPSSGFEVELVSLLARRPASKVIWSTRGVSATLRLGLHLTPNRDRGSKSPVKREQTIPVQPSTVSNWAPQELQHFTFRVIRYFLPFIPLRRAPEMIWKQPT